MAEPSQELELRSSSDIVNLDDFDAIILGRKLPDEIQDNPEEIQRRIVLQLLNAETDEELESFGTAVGWQTLEGVPIRIDGFRWNASDFEQGAPVYVLVSGERLDRAESVILTTGSYNILAQLSNLARRGRLPVVRELRVSERKTKAGYNPLWLVTPDAEKLKQAEALGKLQESLRDGSNPLDDPVGAKAK